jgi:hypothetical protein
MTAQNNLQIQAHRTWSIIRYFYLAQVHFRSEYERYDKKVMSYSRASGVEREFLRLNTEELAGLLEFKSLESLRDDYIQELKDLCHDVFRTADRTDPLDRYVSDIFHEISILKEEHYTVKTYAPQYERDSDEVELKFILDDAHTVFPKKLTQIRYLFGKARERMEKILPTVRSMPIVVRSLYLHRNEDFIRSAYPKGLKAFYSHMYPLGAFEGYYQVAQSFYHSSFFREALKAFRLAENEYQAASGLYKELLKSEKRAGGSSDGDGLPREPRWTIRSIRAKIGRIQKRQAEKRKVSVSLKRFGSGK